MLSCIEKEATFMWLTGITCFILFFFFLIDYNPLQQFICNNCCIPSFILVSFKIDVLKKVNLTLIFNYYNFSIFFPCAQNITSHDLPAEKHAIACRCVHIVFHINLFAFWVRSFLWQCCEKWVHLCWTILREIIVFFFFLWPFNPIFVIEVIVD